MPDYEAAEPVSAIEPYQFDDLRECIETDRLSALDAERLQATAPYTLGQFLTRLEVDQMRQILRLIPIEAASEAVAEMDIEMAAQLLEAMREARAVQLLSELDPDDSADIFGEMETADRERLLKQFDPKLAAQLRRLIAYEPESAGGIMNPQVASVYQEMTVIQTVRLIQKLGEQFEHIPYVYVTDRDNRLAGVVSMRDLVFAGPDVRVESIMKTDIVGTIDVNMDQEDVALVMAELNLNSLPVVDENEKLVGVITHDDILDVIRDEATEDIQKMVGAGGDEAITDSIMDSVRRRFPWLLVNLLTAGLAGVVIAVFEEQIAAATILAVCMPIIANLGGNTGAQTLAIVIRSLATGELQTGEGRSVLYREWIKGLLNGVLIGVISALIIGFYQNDIGVALVVFVAMVASMAYAGAAGALIPILLKHLNLDPAQSSSIFVTATTDIFGFAVFLSLGSLLPIAQG